MTRPTSRPPERAGATALTGSPAGSVFDQLFQRLAALEWKVDDLRSVLTTRRKEQLLVEEVAEAVGRSAYTVRRWIAEGRIHAIRVGGTGPRGRLLVPRAELDRLISGGMGGNVPDSAID